ncbi:hypothetical protein JJC00_35770 [Bradyrhizobium diazoefficiens]|uniref:hypothetical protein n=1 Tax=Bradyrhizobium diazoefficiens TaxID=1355477 RepID=UPI00190D4718|nr:hypothetical protein [Bradyrhizobium diazoefficiens]QQO33791.1 hypothetical protein JJC00_35770 [Bradyrhizobium diazoefficiens]
MDSRIGTNAERPTKGDSLTSDEQCSPTSPPAIDKFAIRGTDSNQIIFDEALLKSPGNLTKLPLPVSIERSLGDAEPAETQSGTMASRIIWRAWP